METVKRTERGWPGHFILAKKCLFRRNTLLEYRGKKIVISTVGRMMSFDNTKFEQTTHNAYYETIAFESDYSKYDDADVEKDIYFKSNCKINKIDGEIEANEMHEIVVKEIADRMVKELK